MPSKTAMCPCCNQEMDEGHKFSPIHKFNFLLWAFDKKRKALAKDKDGIRLEVSIITVNDLSLQLQYNINQGKYYVEVKPEQLESINKTLKFRCCVYNDRKDDVMTLTAAQILDASSLSSCYDDREDWMETNRFIAIRPKERYNGVVVKFHLENLIVGSFKIPFAFNLQTENGKVDVSLCRTIQITVLDWEEDHQPLEKRKSPFTDQLWEKNVKIVPPCRRQISKCKYKIPQKYAKFFKYGFKEWRGIGIQEYEGLNTLKQQMLPGHVSEENYRNFLHNCLWLEENVNALMLNCFNMENVTMKVVGRGELQLEVPGLAEKRPSLVAGDLIRVRVHEDHIGYEGYIRLVEDRNIVIEYIDSELIEAIEINPALEMDVAFQLGRLPYERAHEGIDKVSSSKILKALFPDGMRFRPYQEVFKLHDGDFLNQNIVDNFEQKQAVEKILNSSSQGAPYIVYGPPGTGKTLTIVEAICQIMNKTSKRILVCAPANAACDMLTSKLIPYCNKKQLKRVHSTTRDRSTITKEVAEYSNMTASGEFLKYDAKDLLKYRIVVTTLILIGKFDSTYQPDYLFIDEAAQALETDACVALGMLKPKGSIVLAGDPKQLGPLVQSGVAQEYGFNISLLERLMDTQGTYSNENRNFITMLKKNFRSHPTILKIPNKLFYDSKLNPVSDTPLNDPVSRFAVYPNIKKFNPSLRNGYTDSGHAIEFCAVSSKERREGRSPSYFNPAEANMVIEYVKTLVGMNFGSSHKVKPSDIGVITPYIRQVYKIKVLLQNNKFKEVEVGSTEAFQGREKRILIVSTVRAQHDLLKYDRKYALGFVKQEKRFNVTMTRAISKLIVIGCPTVLATDSRWKSFMEQCREVKAYYGAPFEDRNEKMSQILERFQRFPNFSSRD